MAESNIADSCRWVAEEWARQLTTVFETMMGDAPYVTFAALDSQDGPESADLLWWEQPFSLNSQAILWAGAAASCWQEIGRRVLGSAGAEDADVANIRSTYLEIVRQALSGIAVILSKRAGKEVSCVDGGESEPPANANQPWFSFEVHLGEQALPMVVTVSSGMAGSPEKAAPAAIAVPAAVADPLKAPNPTAAPAKPNSIDLLLDVELPVSVSFGRAQLPLKDVIKLTTGSIVELNRAVSEPVDIIVNNCVIARGEVVVVEGNFGIRIRQVISRQERLRTLY